MNIFMKILTFLIFAALLHSSAFAEKELKLGVVLGLTGDAAIQSGAIREGVELAVEDLSKEGWKLDLHFEDDQTAPQKTVSAVHSLTSRGYRFFIGPSWSFQVKAARPIFEREDAIALIPLGSSGINGGASKAIFNLSPRRDLQMPKIRGWLMRQKYRRALILTPEGDWGQIFRDIFKKAASGAGVKIVEDADFSYKHDIAVFRSILMRNARKNIDVVLTTGSAENLAGIVRASSQLKLGFSFLTTEDMSNAVRMGLTDKEQLKKVYELRPETGKKFTKYYRKRFNKDPRLFADRGYDSLMILAEAIGAVGNDPVDVRKYLSQQLDYEGMCGNIRFNQQGDIIDADYEIASLGGE